MRAGLWVLFAVTFVCCTGCASPPKRKPVDLSVTLPAHWTNAPADTAAALVGVHWWREFDDEPLDEIVHEALANNYDLKAASAALEAAEASARLAGAGGLPSVGDLQE